MDRLAGVDQRRTGCSLHAKKTTLAVATVSSTRQLPVALSLAARVLSASKHINNTPRLAIFGTGISNASPSSVKNVSMLRALAVDGWNHSADLEIKNVNIVVGVDDLAILRLVPSRSLGETCNVPDCDLALCAGAAAGVDAAAAAELQRQVVDETIDCLLRKPPMDYASYSDLPYEWEEHIEDIESFKWVRELWNQSSKEAKTTDATEAVPSPLDVLSLSMYFKVASIAVKTTEMTQDVIKSIVVGVDGAVDAGLLAVFPSAGIAPTFVGFIESHLLGDDYPWQVTERGALAAAKARIVLRRTFDHTSTVASVLSRSDLALEFRDDAGPHKGAENILLMPSGQSGNNDVPRMVYGKLPLAAVASNGKFKVVLVDAPAGTWPQTLNDEFKEVVDALLSSDDAPADGGRAQVLRKRMAAYTALSSRFLKRDKKINGMSKNLFSTNPHSAASHVSSELIVRDSMLLIDSTSVNVAVQKGTSVSCTFATFCPTMSDELASEPFKPTSMSNMNISDDHEKVQAIASALATKSKPLGMLTGTLGGVVELDGVEYRLSFWKTNPDDDDEFVTLLPKSYIDLAFADYATGSRALDEDELEPHRKIPFFAADTIITLFDSKIVAMSNQLVYRLPTAGRLPVLADDEAALYAAYNSNITGPSGGGGSLLNGKQLKLPAKLKGSMKSFLVRESANDRLVGLGIAWSTRILTGSKRVHMLISNNQSAERVSF